jgi:chromosome segregation ATPase
MWKISRELSTCHDVITNLRNENASLNAKVDSNVCDASIPNLRDDNVELLAKIEELNVSLASLRKDNEKLIAKAKELDVCNVTISDLRDNNDILRVKIVELNACKQQNDHIAKLDAKIAEHDLENEKFKFARSMLYCGRRLGIKDGIGFQKGDNVKLNAPPKRLSNFVKGKASMP